MPNNYSPMGFVSGLSGIQGGFGALGGLWESIEKGTSREKILSWINRQARGAQKAGRGIGISNLLGKGVGLLSMVMGLGPVGAGLLSGAISGVGGKWHADKLSKEGAPDVLYGLEDKRKAESAAHSAIDQLIGSVTPQALSTAITTPLQYKTMQNIFSSIPGSGAEEVISSGLPNISTGVADMAKQEALLRGKQTLASFLDPNAYSFATMGEKFQDLGRMGIDDYFKSRFLNPSRIGTL